MLPEELLTWPELQTLGGLAIGVYVLVTAILALYPAAQAGPKLAIAVAVGGGLGIVVAVLSPPVTAQGMVLAVLNGLAGGLLAAGGQPIAAGVWRIALGTPTVDVQVAAMAPRRRDALTEAW